MTSSSASSGVPVATVLAAANIAALEEQSLGDLTGVGRRIFFRDDTSEAGILRLAGGHRLGSHTHRENQHHMWVLDGEAKIAGSQLGAGSYVHVPAGVEHDIDATDTDGCSVFYIYGR